jgi:hypothetical protein
MVAGCYFPSSGVPCVFGSPIVSHVVNRYLHATHCRYRRRLPWTGFESVTFRFAPRHLGQRIPFAVDASMRGLYRIYRTSRAAAVDVREADDNVGIAEA